MWYSLTEAASTLKMPTVSQKLERAVGVSKKSLRSPWASLSSYCIGISWKIRVRRILKLAQSLQALSDSTPKRMKSKCNSWSSNSRRKRNWFRNWCKRLSSLESKLITHTSDSHKLVCTAVEMECKPCKTNSLRLMRSLQINSDRYKPSRKM